VLEAKTLQIKEASFFLTKKFMALQNCIYFALQKLFDEGKSPETALEEAKKTALQTFEE